MNLDHTLRLLGAAQLAVFAASMISERLLAAAAGTGNISDKLVRIADNLTKLRISNVVALANCLAIIALGALFYAVLKDQNPTIAVAALGFFVAEAITLAVSKIGTFALIPLSQEFVEAGAPESGSLLAHGRFLYDGLYTQGYEIHMLFFCVGAILWYGLLNTSGYVPRALALWGLIAVSLLTIPVLVQLYDRQLTWFMVLGLPYAPFEAVLGLWLLVKGLG